MVARDNHIVTLRELGVEAAAAATMMAEAARLARTVQVDAASVRAKADESPVTVADFAVQALVAGRLAQRFPADPLVAEEDASALRLESGARLRRRVVDALTAFDSTADEATVADAVDRGRGEPSARYWTLDPIDGTKGLLRGGQYVVALALIVEGAVEVGAIGCPRLTLQRAGAAEGGVALAVRGRGSWWMPLAGDGRLSPLAVSVIDDPVQARIADSAESAHSDRARQQRLLTALGCQALPLLMDSQAKHVAVAAGQADVLVRFPRPGYQEAIWDQAAGALVVAEAGGRVTDLAGRPFDFSTGRRLTGNEGVLASNGRLHEAVIAAINRTV